MLYAREATSADYRFLANHLREEDVEEIWAASEENPLEALARGYKESQMCFVICNDIGPIAIFGFRDEGLVAYPWLLATPWINKHRLELLRKAPGFLDLCAYPLLTNEVDVRNTLHMRWLKLLGFTFIGSDEPRGGTHFRQFIRVTYV